MSLGSCRLLVDWTSALIELLSIARCIEFVCMLTDDETAVFVCKGIIERRSPLRKVSSWSSLTDRNTY